MCSVPDEPLKVAEDLKAEADELISEYGLGKVLNSFGDVWYRGGYEMNTMVWPDLDIHMVMEPHPWSIERFFELGSQVASLGKVLTMSFHDCAHFPRDGQPEGLHWTWRVDGPDRQIPWKVDLWSTKAELLERDKAQMATVKERMTENDRRKIIEIKQSLLTTEGRTPDSSGRHIYNAVIFEGLETREEIVGYLRKRGIENVLKTMPAHKFGLAEPSHNPPPTRGYAVSRKA